MKCKPELKRAHFWKIQCLRCGVNSELLIDSYKRVICLECLRDYEFTEVENEIYSEDDKEEMEIRTGHDLLCSNIGNESNRDSWNEITDALHGVES